MFPTNQNQHLQVADNIVALRTLPVEMAKGIIKIKKSILYLVIVLSILGVLSGARLKTLDGPTGAKVFYDDANSVRSSETVDFPDYSLDEKLFVDQYADLSP